MYLAQSPQAGTRNTSKSIGQSESTVHPTPQLPRTAALQSSVTPSSSQFEDLLATTDLPHPGPSYYVARRSLWLVPRPLQFRPVESSTSRQRLEDLLSRPGAVADEGVWKAGIEKVWKGLVAGGKLKRRLPMNLVVRCLYISYPNMAFTKIN